MLDVIPPSLGSLRLVRPLLVVGLVLGLGALTVRPMACGGDGRPRGYHSSSVAYGEGELGLVWLNRSAKREHLVFARADGNTARLIGEPFVVSNRALDSGAPLIAYGQNRFLLMWTHRGDDEPGLYASTVRHGQAMRAVRVLPESTPTCSDLVVVDDGFVAGMMHGDGLRLIKLQLEEQVEHRGDTPVFRATPLLDLATMPLTADATSQAASCRLRYDGRNLRLVTTKTDKRTTVVIIPPDDEAITVRDLGEAYDTAALAVAGPHTMLMLADSEKTSAELRHLGSDLTDKSRTPISRSKHVRGLSLENESGRYLGLWFESTATQGLGTVFFGHVEEGTGMTHPRRVSPAKRARPHISTSAAHGRVALTWNDTRDGGTVAWGIVRLGGHDHEGTFLYAPGEAPMASFEVSRGAW